MNLAQAAIARYGAVKVTTASPGQVLVLLYEGLLRFLREAETSMRAGKRGPAGERLSRCHAILQHLLAGLDAQHAPELCARLQSLYIFCQQRLLHANIAQEPDAIAEVVKLLEPLRDAWVTAVAKTAAGR